jgi:hypothetical protein
VPANCVGATFPRGLGKATVRRVRVNLQLALWTLVALTPPGALAAALKVIASNAARDANLDLMQAFDRSHRDLACAILAAGMLGALLAQALAPFAVVAPLGRLPGRHKCRGGLTVEKMMRGTCQWPRRPAVIWGARFPERPRARRGSGQYCRGDAGRPPDLVAPGPVTPRARYLVAVLSATRQQLYRAPFRATGLGVAQLL